MQKLSLLLSFLLLTVGCASNKLSSHETELTTGKESPEQLAMADGEKLICTHKATTGSRIAVKTCRTKSQIEAEREQAQIMMRRMSTRGTAVGGDG
jgi:hypothetical protein